jgi:hypothetical protein
MAPHPLTHATTEGPLGFPMTDRQAVALDQILKALPKGDEFRYRKATIAQAPSEVLSGERSDVSWISTEEPDRTGDVVLARGLNDSQYRLNPIVTMQHAWYLPPVGKSLWRKVVKDGDRHGVKAKTQYPLRPADWPRDKEWPADLAFSLVQADLLRGKSIGFLPTKVHPPSRDELTKPGWEKVALVIDEWLLLEYACTFLPTQQNALVEAVSKSAVKVDDDFLKAMGLDPALLAKSDLSTQAQREAAQYKLRDANGDIKYPINDCADVADAWRLRGNSSIPKEKVEAYIRRVAAKLGCEGPWNDGKAMLPDNDTGVWHAYALSTFTPLEEIEKALLQQIARCDLKALAEQAAKEALERARGRV